MKNLPAIRMLLTALVLCPALLVTVAVGADHTKDSLPTVQAALEAGTAVLVDVRERSEWNAGYIDKAVHVPLSELNNGLQGEALKQRLPADTVLYTYCKAGVRSRLAADRLKAAGYDVRALKAGYQDLLNAKFPKGSE